MEYSVHKDFASGSVKFVLCALRAARMISLVVYIT